MSLLVAAGTGFAARRRERRPAVRWSPPAGEVRELGLSVRVVGSGTPRWLLLHGLFRSGRYWSAEFDDLGGRVIAPDLLGFGRSRSAAPPTADGLTAATHADAIADCLDELDVTEPVVLVGHSVGAVIAAHLASRHPDRVAAIVAINPALFADAEHARAQLSNADPYTRLFLAQERLSEAVCELMCRRRRLARIATRLANPRMPTPLNDDAVEHTWPSYHGTLANVVIADDHRQLVTGLPCPMHVIVASEDRVVDATFLEELSSLSHVTTDRVPDAGHDLPVTDPAGCVGMIRTVCARSGG